MVPADVVWILLFLLGLRLLYVSFRERSLPEAALGLLLLTTAPGGALVRYALVHRTPGPALVAIPFLAVGMLSMLAFTRLVFRRSSRAALGLALGLGALTLASAGAQALALTQPLGHHSRPNAAFVLARVLIFGWAAFESARFRRMYVRRAALGLADPEVSNRFLLFTVWTSALALMALGTFASALSGDLALVSWQRLVLALSRVVGGVAAVTIYLTFLPPKAYLRWLERRHAARFGGAA